MGHLLSLAKPPVITGIGVGIHEMDHHEEYCAAGRWRLHLYSTPVTVIADGRATAMRPGYAALWAPQAQLRSRFSGRAVHMCAHFEAVPVEIAADGVSIPEVQDLAVRFATIDAALQEAGRWFAGSPHRAEARLWDLLWQLAEPPPAPARPAHPALERARDHIQARLNRVLDVAGIAAAAGCSSNHLLRLFRRELGTTIVAYIRDCRVHRSAYLLRNSAIPIKEIAAEVGIPDLHFFNKTIRRELGKSPSDVRAETGET